MDGARDLERRRTMKKVYLAVVGALVLASGSALGQLAEMADGGSLDAADVLTEVEPRPAPYPVNSAIVLTNPHDRPAGFRIELYDHEGNVAGSGSRTVAPRALEVVWVSTLLNDEGARFVGWGIAKSERPLQCNAFLAGIGVTQLPVEGRRVRNSSGPVRRKLFPVLAAF
jgi:hypothetical protein